MNTIIGLHGPARSGKDTFANMLGTYGYRRMAFADPLKKAAAVLLGVSEDYVFDDANKERLVPGWSFTLRDFLQRLGTEAVRNTFRQDFWIHRWEIEAMSHPGSVVVSDVRFENEADAIRRMGGHIIHIRRDGAGLPGTEGAHPSEAGIRYEPGDGIVLNNGTLRDLAVEALDLHTWVKK